MGLKIFIKEHLSFIIFEIILVLFILLLFYLDGFRNIDTAIYTISISLILIISFLGVRYFLRQSYLNKITQLPTSMEDALQKMPRPLNILKQNVIYMSCTEYINKKYKLCMQRKIAKISF